MKRRLAIAAAGCLVGTAAGLHLLSKAPWQPFGELVTHVPTSEKVVAITFDDGPTPGPTQEVLEVLARHDARATFFLVGKDMERHPGAARALVQAGHEVGNHSFSHTRMVIKSPAFVRDELTRTDSLLRAAGHAGPIHFRPPYGKKLFVLPWELSERNTKSILWDVDGDPDPSVATQTIVRDVLDHVRPGSIILLHIMYSSRRNSLAAVEPILAGLKEQGYRFVTVSELLALGAADG